MKTTTLLLVVFTVAAHASTVFDDYSKFLDSDYSKERYDAVEAVLASSSATADEKGKATAAKLKILTKVRLADGVAMATELVNAPKSALDPYVFEAALFIYIKSLPVAEQMAFLNSVDPSRTTSQWRAEMGEDIAFYQSQALAERRDGTADPGKALTDYMASPFALKVPARYKNRAKKMAEWAFKANDPDAIRWAKWDYLVRDIRESEATSKFIAKVLTQRDGDDTAAKAFAKYQASGEGDNPLADIKIPDQVVALAQAAPPDAMKNKEATRLITAGDFTGALTAAKAYLATLPPDKNDAGVYGVGDVIRSKYENTVLATDYLADHENTPVSF